MVKQWNSESDDWVTILSMISMWGLPRIHSVIASPSASRSLALVAENTLTPLTCATSYPPWVPGRPGRSSPRGKTDLSAEQDSSQERKLHFHETSRSPAA